MILLVALDSNEEAKGGSLCCATAEQTETSHQAQHATQK
jgi:hypothetical protein